VVDFLRAWRFISGLDGKELLSPFFLLQNSVADWGNSAKRMQAWRDALDQYQHLRMMNLF